MIENFSLKGKVAIVTGCAVGLGQGMALGLAKAGADIVGVDYIDTADTKKLTENTGAKFLGKVANLLNIDVLDSIVEKAVGEKRIA